MKKKTRYKNMVEVLSESFDLKTVEQFEYPGGDIGELRVNVVALLPKKDRHLNDEEE